MNIHTVSLTPAAVFSRHDDVTRRTTATALHNGQTWRKQWRQQVIGRCYRWCDETQLADRTATKSSLGWTTQWSPCISADRRWSVVHVDQWRRMQRLRLVDQRRLAACDCKVSSSDVQHSVRRRRQARRVLVLSQSAEVHGQPSRTYHQRNTKHAAACRLLSGSSSTLSLSLSLSLCLSLSVCFSILVFLSSQQVYYVLKVLSTLLFMVHAVRAIGRPRSDWPLWLSDNHSSESLRGRLEWPDGPTRPDPTRGWTRPVPNSGMSTAAATAQVNRTSCLYASQGRTVHLRTIRE